MHSDKLFSRSGVKAHCCAEMCFRSTCLQGNGHTLQYLWSIWPHHVYPQHLQGLGSARLDWLLAAWGLVDRRPELQLTGHT